MMRLIVFAKKEGVGVEAHSSLSSALYGLYLLGLLQNRKMSIKEFCIYFITGKLKENELDILKLYAQESEIQLLLSDEESSIIAATPHGYRRLCRSALPVKKMERILPKEVYQKLKKQKGGEQKHANKQ